LYKRDICQIDKEWLKGRLQECVINDDTGEVVAITAEDASMAEKIAALLNIDAANKPDV